MSNIAGLLSSLLPSPQPDASARGPSGQRDSATPGKGGASGFDAILSKMGQNGAQANAGGAAKSGPNPLGATAANAGTNTIIENAIASIDAQTPAGAALRAAGSASASLQSSNAAAKTPGTPGALSASGAALPGTGTLAGTLASQATAAADAQPANSDSTPASGVLAQLPAALAQALNSGASGSVGSTDNGKGAAKSNAANPANAAADNVAANAAAMTVDMVVAGQPVVTPTSTDKANAGGKTSRSTSADGTGRTTSKQNASSANTNAAVSGTTLDPSLQSAVLASVGLNGGALQPSQPSLLAPSGGGQGASDPDLKAIMTASAVATANSAAKLGTGAEDTGDNAGLTIVSVLSTETHFAPPAQLSPVQQIADTVIGALPNPLQPFGASGASAADDTSSTGAASAASASSVPDSGTTAIAGPVKILNLQLEPPSLGTVTINLSLSDGGLNVQLAASQASTMSMIDKDKDALSNQLRDSGYSVAGVGVTITIDGSNVGHNGSATQDQMGQSAAQGGQTMSNGGSSNGNGSGQSGGNGTPQQPLPQTADFSPSSAARSPAAGDLYI